MSALPPRSDRAPWVDFKDRRAPDDNRPAWFWGTVCAIVFLGFVSWIGQRDEALERKLAQAEDHWRTYMLRDCPPPTAGMTDTVVLVVRSTADDQPTVTGCSRIAERSYSARHRPW